jgi:hypothetical protein
MLLRPFFGCLVALAACTIASLGQSATGKGACKRAAIEGEVSAGQYFERHLGNGLEVMLEPIASGWIVRVLPYAQPRGPHDYAELATLPYQSVSPLLLSTDFSFRAQDAIAWNPRRFHFAPSAEAFRQLSVAYQRYNDTPSPAAEAKLVELTARTPEASLQLLDAKIVPGAANQAQMAAPVATHLASTPHSVEQSADRKPSPLGKIAWLRFRVEFDLPEGFHADAGVLLSPRACQ